LRGRRLLGAVLCTAIALIAASAPGAADAAGSGGIEGEVVGPGSAPLAEVWACASPAHDEGLEERCDLTDSSGTYLISSLTAGDYKVEFLPELTGPSYVGEFYDDKPTWEAADTVAVGEGVVVTGIDAELAEAATIEGEVRAASSGAPVERALVCAQVPAGPPGGCVTTRPDGTYTLPGLPAGEYKVQFLPNTFVYNLLSQFYDHKSSFAEADALTVAAGETKTGIDADLEAGAVIRGATYSALTGAALSGIRVCVLFPEGGEWRPLQCLPTGGGGQYVFMGLAANSYKVVFSVELWELFGTGFFAAEPDGYLTQYFNRKATLGAADPLTLSPPTVRSGVDGLLQPEVNRGPTLLLGRVGSRPRPLPRKHCRPGFKPKRVAGKKRCVKIRKHHH
jgi:hypothetical protein